ncbi:MAG: hypothetical protein ACRD63_05280, partial [Pyrinomonadaceae bacterium]
MTKELEERAVKGVRAALGDDVDCRARLLSVLRAVWTGNELEFLNGVNADVVDLSADRAVVNIARAVDRRRGTTTQTVYRNIIETNVRPLLRVVAEGR